MGLGSGTGEGQYCLETRRGSPHGSRPFTMQKLAFFLTKNYLGQNQKEKQLDTVSPFDPAFTPLLLPPMKSPLFPTPLPPITCFLPLSRLSPVSCPSPIYHLSLASLPPITCRSVTHHPALVLLYTTICIHRVSLRGLTNSAQGRSLTTLTCVDRSRWQGGRRGGGGLDGLPLYAAAIKVFFPWLYMFL